MPVLAQASIYHEEKNLHASDLKRWEDNSNKEISWRSMSQVYKITAQNRLAVMAALMFIFNQQLSLIQKSALYHLCKISSKLVTQGFNKHGHSYRPSYGNEPMNNSMSSASMNSSTSSAPIIKQNPRIPLSQQFLVEILHAIYFAMFNEFASAAIQAVDDIHSRACYELFPDVILVTNAIKNSLQANPSGENSGKITLNVLYLRDLFFIRQLRSTERWSHGYLCSLDAVNNRRDRIQIDDNKCIVSHEKAARWVGLFLRFRDPELRLFYPSASIILMFRKSKFQFLSVQTNMLMLPSHLSSPFFECKVTSSRAI